MQQVNMHEAKTHFSRIIAAVERGAEILIARDGKPVARVVPVLPLPQPPRTPGSAKGQFVVPASFFEPLPEEVLKSFES